ncbi:MAG: 3'-5' exonuclease [archaeon]
MIVVDIETSGMDFVKCGIWQIGAVDLETMEEFLEEGRIDDDEQIISEGKRTVFEVTGKTEKELKDKLKQSQKQLITNFLKWVEKRQSNNFICQNPQFDHAFISVKARKYGLKIPFHYRAFDLHSIANIKYFQIHNKFLEKEGKSDMGLRNILSFVGMRDERGIHNALEDSKLTAECFSRLVHGKSLLKEYKKYPIPDYLKQ